MIFAANAYDPDEPEGSKRRGSEYANRKFLLAFILGILAVLAMLYPLFEKLKRERFAATCKSNLGAISKALQQYAADNNDTLPPVYQAFGGDDKAILDPNQKLPMTWATIVKGYLRTEKEAKCPACAEGEAGKLQDGLELSYGMYVPLGMRSPGLMSNPARTAMLTETSNLGFRGVANPKPLLDVDGKPLTVDTFAIGFDSGNLPHPNTYKASNYVSRLSFYDASTGDFREDGACRHPSGIHVIFADGSLGTIKPPAANVRRMGKETNDLIGIWATR